MKKRDMNICKMCKKETPISTWEKLICPEYTYAELESRGYVISLSNRDKIEPPIDCPYALEHVMETQKC